MSNRRKGYYEVMRIGWILRFCITLATVLVLAFIAQNTLSFLVDFKNREPRTFVIQAIAKEGASSEDASQELWI